MGFFSDLIDVTPHRTIGQKAKEYCINSLMTDNETRLIDKYNIDKEKYIKVRNVCQISMFIAMFQLLESENPKARFGIANTHFQQLYWDYYHNSGEQTGYAMWDSQLEDFCFNVTGQNFSELSLFEQNEFREIVDNYQSGVIDFFKKHNRKLSEQIQ
ncbi:hypothetical protein [Paraglaciecola sp. MB-3u-78]|uniref:hypothetical protein n=1 Tax=Paraglaciecola sp. MB-3u-78 TaxID=2058332 RepID=UPI000C341D54|nr:hypothetical protein [Paraglaciecola sp. MB-3u-78]PKH00894.1 hypothetical protein CXF95_01385 [Paraglaciecola sp. MB-3u-78]